jgi:hypothetical protein
MARCWQTFEKARSTPSLLRTTTIGSPVAQVAREGKGYHEIWEARTAKRRISVDSAIVSRHWANRVLKWANLQNKF